jgi:adenylate cyclase class IV
MERTTGRAGQAARATLGTEAVEVKATVIERDERRALRALRLQRKDGEQRRIFFYDTRKLDLYKRGVALRARECSGECESTVKIRPVDPKRVAGKWRKKSGFKVEADVVGSKVIRSASYTIAQKRKEIDEVASGKRPVEKLFSGEQEEFLRAMAPVRVDFGELVPLGPVAAMRWKVRNEGLPYELCVEEWRLPDGRDAIEVSIKARRPEAAAAQAALDGFLAELGIAKETRQQTKTLTALEYFAAQSGRRRSQASR